MAKRKISRNTSKQIVSYTNLDDGMEFGNVEVTADKTLYPLARFNDVIDTEPVELIEPIPDFEVNVIARSQFDEGSNESIILKNEIELEAIPLSQFRMNVSSSLTPATSSGSNIIVL